MNSQLKQQLESQFNSLWGDIDLAYSDETFNNEKECIEWYENIYGLIKSEEENQAKKFINHDDKAVVSHLAQTVKQFVTDKLMNEKYSSNQFLDYKLLRYLNPDSTLPPD